MVLAYGTIFFLSVFLLFVLEGLTAEGWSRYMQGDFRTSISLGFVVSCVLITALCMVIYGLLFTRVFDLRAKRNLPKSILVGGFMLVFVLQYVLQEIVWFEGQRESCITWFNGVYSSL